MQRVSVEEKEIVLGSEVIVTPRVEKMFLGVECNGTLFCE